MDKKKSIISGVGFLFVLIVGIILYLVWPKQDPKLHDPIGFKTVGQDNTRAKKKKSRKVYQTTYQLDALKFFALPDENKSTYVDIQVSLAYPINDHETESEIILKREQINKFIKLHISTKSFYQLKEANKREAIKYELLSQINKILKKPIQDIYFIRFLVMTRPKTD